MNKKGTKKLSGVLAATTVLTSVAGATPVFAQGTNWDALYKTAYEAMQKAEKEKTQESINVARKAIAEVAKNKKLVSMASTLSEKVDAVQQGLFNDLYALMYVDGKPKANMTQEEINKAKALVVSFATCPSNKAYIPTWSSAIDPYQQKNIDKLVEAIKTAETTKKAEDIKAARKLANEFLTVTNADMKKAAEGLDVQLAQVEAPEAVKAVEAIKVNELKLENQKEVQAQLDNAKKLAEKVKDEKVKKELTDKIAKSEKAINDKFVALEKLNVEKATVTHANTIKVELSKAVKAEDQAKTNFVVKRGNINVSVSAKWAKDGKSVELVAGNAFVAGDYSILATSGEAIATAKVTVEAQKETSLTIDSSVLNGVEENGTVKVSLKDQYGDEYKLDRDKFTVTAFNKTQGKNVEFENNKFELKHDKYKKDDVILVTILHNKTGLTVQKELKVVDSAYVDTISLGKVELSKEDKNGLTRASKNVKISYEAKDQFGNAVELKAGKDNDDIVVISSDSSVLAEGKVEVKNEDKKNYLEISGFEKSGKVVLTVMSKSSGKTARVELDVKEAPGVISNVKLETSDVTIAAGAKHIIGLEVTDNYGKKLEKEKYEKEFTFTSTNPSVVASSEVSVKGGKVELTVKNDAVKNSKTTISILNQNKIVATINVTAGEKAVATNIELKDGVKPATTLAVGAKTKVEFVVKDQYGNIMEKDITVKNQKNDESKIDAKATKNVVEVEALKEGAEKLVVTLGDNGDSKEITFNVVKNVSTMGLEIANIPELCKEGKDYSEQIKVQNKNGVVLPADSIVKVISANEKLVHVNNDNTIVAGAEAKKLAEKEDAKTKITVIYNAADKAVTLEKEVTVSAKNVKVDQINVLDKKLNNNKIDKDAKKVDIKEVKAENPEISNLYFITKDNFGKYAEVTKKGDLTILSVAGENVEVTSNQAVDFDDKDDNKLKLDITKLNLKDENKDAIVRLVLSKDGAVAMVNLKVTGLKEAKAAQAKADKEKAQ
ncbi:hypothetical protein [Hathewaya limosa]|uniref:SbsC C-terminal domain-containing protein n=1 Tax=Hathewaya limosa TaxID=1536 RepID=A0ABU0JYM3_HATLI|nr:hypothetical protein [Hathewaya limosa]MDQ0481002.1 hypothetical protein [Hathewaya limosa]